MANHLSAEKRARKTIKRRARAKMVKGGMRAEVRKALEVVEKGDRAASAAACREAEREINKAVTKGALPRRTAARIVSRLARKAAAVKPA